MRDKVTWCPSPNFRAGVAPRNVTCIVLHATATSGIDSPRQWLCDKASGVSAHYLVGKDGAILQLVDEKDVAWHAGVSSWRGQTNMNSISVGIEIVNANDGKDPYPEAQVEAVAGLVAAMCKDYGVKPQDVIGHLDIAPGRKTDPAGFDFDEFRMKLVDLGVV